jgi:cell division protein FtsB
VKNPHAPADEPRHPARSAATDRASTPNEADEPSAAPGDPAGGPADRIDLTGLSIAGITRRRVGWAAAGLLAVWIVIVFARQVGDATNASGRATQLAQDNAALVAEVESLQREVDRIVQPAYVAIQARGHGLGGAHEIPFALAPSVPEPVDGAPGSSSVRLGARVDRQTPLEAWLSLLFGPEG